MLQAIDTHVEQCSFEVELSMGMNRYRTAKSG